MSMKLTVFVGAILSVSLSLQAMNSPDMKIERTKIIKGKQKHLHEVIESTIELSAA